MEAIKEMAHTHPNIQRLIKEALSILLLLLIFARRRMIQVMTPITGTAIKNNNVPHAIAFCQPSVNTKSLNGNTPMAAIASANKATTIARLTQPIIK